MSMDEYSVKDSFPLPRNNKLRYKLCDAECMTHLNFRNVYSHIVCLMMVQLLILSLRQAFQGLTPSGSACLLEMLKLRDHQYSKDA